VPFKLGPFEGLLPLKVGLSTPSKVLVDSRIDQTKFTEKTSLSDIASDYELLTLAIPELIGLDPLGLYRGSEDKIITTSLRDVTAYKLLFPATPLFAGLTRDAKDLSLNYALLALPKSVNTTKFLQWLATVATTADLDLLNNPTSTFDRLRLLATTVPNVTFGGNYSLRKINSAFFSSMPLQLQTADELSRVPVWYAGISRVQVAAAITVNIQFDKSYSPNFVRRELLKQHLGEEAYRAFKRNATPVQFTKSNIIDTVAKSLSAKSNDPYNVSSVDKITAPVELTVPGE
jgi:hypothetical protein